jgi:hypothetical protein
MQYAFKTGSLHSHLEMIHLHTFECYLEHNAAQAKSTNCCSEELGVWAVACALKDVS